MVNPNLHLIWQLLLPLPSEPDTFLRPHREKLQPYGETGEAESTCGEKQKLGGSEELEI